MINVDQAFALRTKIKEFRADKLVCDPYDVTMAVADDLLAAGKISEEEIDLFVHVGMQYVEKCVENGA